MILSCKFYKNMTWQIFKIIFSESMHSYHLKCTISQEAQNHGCGPDQTEGIKFGLDQTELRKVRMRYD